MERSQILGIICDCVSSALHCDPHEVNEDFGLLVTFGWDSLAQVEIFCAVEKALELSFPDQMIEKLITVRKYVDYAKSILDLKLTTIIPK